MVDKESKKTKVYIQIERELAPLYGGWGAKTRQLDN